MTARLHWRIAPGLAGTLLICGAACAQQDGATADSAQPESELVLPAAPAKADLLPFYVSATTTLKFAVDGKSLTVTEDGIVRYTLVITSPAGATNVSHEGIRCSTSEKKLYATGRPDGSWSPARRDVWSPITDVGANRQHAALAKDYFCEGEGVAGKASAIVDRLRRQKTLK